MIRDGQSWQSYEMKEDEGRERDGIFMKERQECFRKKE